jgi:uncharacterized membrane protein
MGGDILVTSKRVVWSTILGLITGILCYLMSKDSVDPYPGWMVFTTIFNRTLIGFCIGTSGLRWNWVLHGIFWGLLVSLLMAIPAWGAGSFQGFYLIMIAGAVWGFLIELFTSKVFKAPQGGFAKT